MSFSLKWSKIHVVVCSYNVILIWPTLWNDILHIHIHAYRYYIYCVSVVLILYCCYYVIVYSIRSLTSLEVHVLELYDNSKLQRIPDSIINTAVITYDKVAWWKMKICVKMISNTMQLHVARMEYSFALLWIIVL